MECIHRAPFWCRHDKDKGKIVQVWYNPSARCVERKSWETEIFSARLHRPVHLVYFESFATKEEALAREAAIKKLTRAAKLALIDTAEKKIYNK